MGEESKSTACLNIKVRPSWSKNRKVLWGNALGKMCELKEKWASFSVEQWRDLIYTSGNYFRDLNARSQEYIVQRALSLARSSPSGQVKIIDIGCGTGDFLHSVMTECMEKASEKNLHVSAVGLDVNKKFLEFATKTFAQDMPNLEFVYKDACKFDEITDSLGSDVNLLFICINNTVGILPEKVRSTLFSKLNDAMSKSKGEYAFVCTYWHGQFFGHGLQHFYAKNPKLCGDLEGAHIDWENYTMTTKTGYKTTWFSTHGVYETMINYGMQPIHLEASNRGIIVDCTSRSDYVEDIEITTSEEKVTRAYYDSNDAATFYKELWGGDNIHIGYFDTFKTVSTIDTVRKASHASTVRLAAAVPLRPYDKVMDMGAALGGLSRYLAETYDVNVVGVDLSTTYCEHHAVTNMKKGLSHRIKVKCASFTNSGEPSGSFDVVYSMDSFLHAGKARAQVVEEAARLLKPGGHFVFSDIMESPHASKEDLQPIYDRIKLNSMGSVPFYKEQAKRNGLELVNFEPRIEHCRHHYYTVLQVLRKVEKERGADFRVSAEYIRNMKKGLEFWVDAADKGLLEYGMFVFRKA